MNLYHTLSHATFTERAIGSQTFLGKGMLRMSSQTKANAPTGCRLAYSRRLLGRKNLTRYRRGAGAREGNYNAQRANKHLLKSTFHQGAKGASI